MCSTTRARSPSTPRPGTTATTIAAFPVSVRACAGPAAISAWTLRSHGSRTAAIPSRTSTTRSRASGSRRSIGCKAVGRLAAEERLETDCEAVAPHVAAADIAALDASDDLRAAEVVIGRRQFRRLMSAARQFGDGFRRERFEVHLQSLLDAETRRIDRALRRLVVVGHAHHQLHMTLRLHGAAHQAEAHQRFAILRDEARNDGLEGP